MGKWLNGAKAQRTVMDKAGEMLTDEQAVTVKSMYKTWASLVAIGYTAKQGYRFTHNGDLFKTAQPEYTFVAIYEPNTAGTESLFTRIDETHAGTLDDPIPYEGNMELFDGNSYIQYDVIYRCTRNTEQPVTHDLSALVGLYVEVVA